MVDINDPDDSVDIGSSLQQKPTAAQYLGDPRIRNALLSFAAQAFTGGWGGPASQFGQAMGAGLKSAGDTETIAHQQAQEDKKLKQAATIAKEHNATQIETAKIHAQAMKDAWGARLAGRNSPDWTKIFLNTYNDPKHLAMGDEERRQLAEQTADLYASRPGAAGTGPGSAAPPTGVPAPGPKGATTVNPAAGTPKATIPKSFLSNIDLEKFKTDPDYREGLYTYARKAGPGTIAEHELDQLKKRFGIDQPAPGPSPLDKLLKLLRPAGGGTPPPMMTTPPE